MRGSVFPIFVLLPRPCTAWAAFNWLNVLIDNLEAGQPIALGPMASARLSSLVEVGWIIELANLMLRKGVRGLEVEAEADGFGRFHRFLIYH